MGNICVADSEESSQGIIAGFAEVSNHLCMIYNISTAQKNFEKLVKKALAGEEVILAIRNDLVARMLPVARRKRTLKKR